MVRTTLTPCRIIVLPETLEQRWIDSGALWKRVGNGWKRLENHWKRVGNHWKIIGIYMEKSLENE